MIGQTEFALNDDNALDGNALVDVPDEKWPESLARLVDLITVVLRRRGRDEELAIDDAVEIAIGMAKDQGGRPLYLARGDRLQQALIARKIYLLHRGNNVDELAARFGYTTRHIMRIYAEQRALHIRKVQPDLFGATIAETTNVTADGLRRTKMHR